MPTWELAYKHVIKQLILEYPFIVSTIYMSRDHIWQKKQANALKLNYETNL
jgi:hypothetical protein